MTIIILNTIQRLLQFFLIAILCCWWVDPILIQNFLSRLLQVYYHEVSHGHCRFIFGFCERYTNLPRTLLNLIVFDFNHLSYQTFLDLLSNLHNHIYALPLNFLSTPNLRFVLLYCHTSRCWMSSSAMGQLKSPAAPGSTVMLVETPISSLVHVSSFRIANQWGILLFSQHFFIVLTRLLWKWNKCFVEAKTPHLLSVTYHLITL